MTSRPSRPPHPAPRLGTVSPAPQAAREMNLAGVTSTIENAHSALLASEKALALVINQLVSGDPPIPTDEHPHPNTILHRLVDASHGLHGTIERVNNLINTLGAQVQE